MIEHHALCFIYDLLQAPEVIHAMSHGDIAMIFDQVLRVSQPNSSALRLALSIPEYPYRAAFGIDGTSHMQLLILSTSRARTEWSQIEKEHVMEICPGGGNGASRLNKSTKVSLRGRIGILRSKLQNCFGHAPLLAPIDTMLSPVDPLQHELLPT